MPHPCFCPIGDASDVIGGITEETLAECPSCGWIGKCEQGEGSKWRLPTHKRLMAKDDTLPLPDRLKVVWHGAPGYVQMASADVRATYEIPRTRHTYCHWEMTSVRYRPQGFEYWTDERLVNPPKATFL
jgi:hypothetical protein